MNEIYAALQEFVFASEFVDDDGLPLVVADKSSANFALAIVEQFVDPESILAKALAVTPEAKKARIVAALVKIGHLLVQKEGRI